MCNSLYNTITSVLDRMKLLNPLVTKYFFYIYIRKYNNTFFENALLP